MTKSEIGKLEKKYNIRFVQSGIPDVYYFCIDGFFYNDPNAAGYYEFFLQYLNKNYEAIIASGSDYSPPITLKITKDPKGYRLNFMYDVPEEVYFSEAEICNVNDITELRFLNVSGICDNDPNYPKDTRFFLHGVFDPAKNKWFSREQIIKEFPEYFI